MRIAPYVLAAFFAAWGLRGLSSACPVDPDAARHAMNGVFLHDLVQSGKLAHPVQYAKAYFSRLPALSLPYHPPLFPAIEALFFFGLGVNLLAARLAIAVMAAASVVFLTKLLLATHRSHAVALGSAFVFFSLPSVQRVSCDVMLEIPALLFALWAVWLLRDLETGFTMRHALAFALAGGAAVWTKQNTLYLGLVPFLYAAIARRWAVLRERAIWIGSALFGCFFAVLTALSAAAGASGNPRWSHAGILEIVRHNIGFYLGALRDEFGTIGAGVILLALAAAVLKPKKGDGLYGAWALAVFALVVVLPPYDSRYLIFAYPALIALGLIALQRLAARPLGLERAWVVPGVAAGMLFAINISTPASMLLGPSQAAAAIMPRGPHRILYCGHANGGFIFRVRTLDSNMRVAVVRGDKLPDSALSPEGFEKFAHDYGIQYVALEHTSVKRTWDWLYGAPPPSLRPAGEFSLASTDPLANGRLRVFRFMNPSPAPASVLDLRTLTGGSVQADLDSAAR